MYEKVKCQGNSHSCIIIIIITIVKNTRVVP